MIVTGFFVPKVAEMADAIKAITAALLTSLHKAAVAEVMVSAAFDADRDLVIEGSLDEDDPLAHRALLRYLSRVHESPWQGRIHARMESDGSVSFIVEHFSPFPPALDEIPLLHVRDYDLATELSTPDTDLLSLSRILSIAPDRHVGYTISFGHSPPSFLEAWDAHADEIASAMDINPNVIRLRKIALAGHLPSALPGPTVAELIAASRRLSDLYELVPLKSLTSGPVTFQGPDLGGVW